MTTTCSNMSDIHILQMTVHRVKRESIREGGGRGEGEGGREREGGGGKEGE